MSKKRFIYRLGFARRLSYGAFAAVILLSAFLFLFISQHSSAAQITARSLTLSNAIPGSTSAQYTFTFTVASTTDVEGLKFEACTTAVGTCSTPTGLSFSSRTFGAQSGWQGATNFAVDATGANDCTPSARIICANRTDTTAQTATSRNIRFETLTNPTTANSTFFVRMTTYGTNNYTVGSITDTGTVAAAVVQTLTVSAAVAEVLNFCIGATSINDATTSVGAACANVTGTTVNLGVLDSATVNVSPVDTTLVGNDLNGVAMLRTNAFSGATIDYEAIQQSGTEQLGTLRISGATCNAVATTLTDQCIQAQGTTQATFNAGSSERFGMTIGGVNCGSTSSYTCTFSSGTYNLVRDAAYDGDGTNTYVADENQLTPTTAGFAWDASGTSDRIAASSSVVDDEALILKFAAFPAITTPFGSYSAQADFIAVATY